MQRFGGKCLRISGLTYRRDWSHESELVVWLGFFVVVGWLLFFFFFLGGPLLCSNNRSSSSSNRSPNAQSPSIHV